MMRRIHHDQSGAVAVLTAFILVALLAASAVAVDVGRLAASSRDQQGVTDRMALDAVLAVRDTAGDTSAKRAGAVTAALTSLGDNVGLGRIALSDDGFDLLETRLRIGRWDPATRTLDEASDAPNAVEVWTGSAVSSLFAPGTSDVERVTTARLSDPIGVISVRSSTARLDGGLLNAIAEERLGISDLGLGAIAYDGGATPTVRLGDLLDADGSVLTADEVLDLPISAAGLAEAYLGLLAADGDDVETSAVIDDLEVIDERLALPPVPLGDIANVTTENPSEALDAQVDVFDLINASAQAAARDAGPLPVDLGIAGITDVTLRLTQPEQIAIGPPGDPDTVARTSQGQLDVVLDLDQFASLPIVGDLLDTVVGTVLEELTDLLTGVTCTLLGLIVSCADGEVTVTPGSIVLSLEFASAVAPLSTLTCPEGLPEDGEPLMVAATSDTVDVSAAHASLSGNLLGVTGDANGDVTLDPGTSLALGNHSELVDLSGPVPTPRHTVTADTSLALETGALLGTGDLNQVANGLLTPVTELLNATLLGDDGPVAELLDELGLSIGQAEVALLDATCGRGGILVR